MLDRVAFLWGEALQGMRRHGLMSFAAVSTVAVALYLLGGLGLIYGAASRYANDFASRFEIRAHLKDDVTMAQITAAAQSARKIEGVKAVVWIPKDKAWEKMKEKYPEYTENIENPLPHALKITITDVADMREVVTKVRTIAGVSPDEVQFHDDTLRLLQDLQRFIPWLGFVLGGLLFGTAGILIFNAIRLAIDSRRREIRIMQLVGASHATIRVPFLIEGLVQGAVGGLVATLLLWATYDAVRTYIQANLSVLSQPGAFAAMPIALVLAAAGSVYGLLCSFLAIRKPARFRGQPA